MVYFSNFTSTEMVVEYVRETFQWSLKETRPSIRGPSLRLTSSSVRGITCRISVKYLMWALQQLYWGPFKFWFENVNYRLRGAFVVHPMNPPADLASSSSPVEVSGLGDAPPVSSDEEYTLVPLPSIIYYTYKLYYRSSSGDVPEGLAGPQVVGHHPQFPSLPAFIDGRLYPGGDLLLLSDSSSRCSSSEGVSTSSSYHEALSAPAKSVLKRKGHSPVGLVLEIVAEGQEFLRVVTRSDPQDGQASHFLDPKVIPILKRTALEKQYLLPAAYTFVIPKADATVNESLAKCVAVYHAALNYDLRFPLHPVIEEILNKYKLAPAQIVRTSWAQHLRFHRYL
ncbi:hypothetical protein Cgig2_019157 [Carnegiea gigantea]|uniref:Uncharacterized protein n=1 Tax=Carnegiea gigantea TaxID=171969 RepID=A0A9Q1GKV2_9CARY|nr:hypothetical protein Cgig2_019157 [Carnegiea gigantea]